MTIENGAEADPGAAQTLPQLLRAAAAAYGDDIAISLVGATGTDDTLSFAALEQKSAILARGLLARGVGKGARIGFIHGNGPGFALVLAAIARIGAVAIPISTLLKADELVRVLRQADVGGLFLQRTLLGHDYVQRLCAALPELAASAVTDLRLAKTPYLRWVCSTGAGLPPGIEDMNMLARQAETVGADILSAVEAEIHPADQMIEIYTSGSMAAPKGVKHTHGAVLGRAQYLKNMLSTGRGQTVPAPLPMFWVGGLMMYLLPNLVVGATTSCTEATPTDSRFAMGTVMAPQDLALMQQVKTLWALGMTETLGPYAYAERLRDPRYPLCAPLEHMAQGFEVRLADASGAPVPQGERGEIQVRGEALTPGLHKLERAACFTADGFYHTGDMGVAEGSCIYFTGRDGDMIKTASANVSPAEVEMELQQFDAVGSAYVVGLPDQSRGQLVVAALVPREGAALDLEAIGAAMRQKLSSYKQPRAYVPLTREEVPMLPSNKVSRRQLERLLAKKLGRT